MCWFVTLGVSPAGAAALEVIGHSRSGLHVRKSSNPHVARIFGDADIRFDVTHGGCSCDFYAAVPEPDPNHIERARARYRRKGWSEAKIARALEASAPAKTATVGRNRDGGPRPRFAMPSPGRLFSLVACVYSRIRTMAPRTKSESSRRVGGESPWMCSSSRASHPISSSRSSKLADGITP